MSREREEEKKRSIFFIHVIVVKINNNNCFRSDHDTPQTQTKSPRIIFFRVDICIEEKENKYKN